MCTLLCIKNEELNGREGQREIEDEGKAVQKERERERRSGKYIQWHTISAKFNI